MYIFLTCVRIIFSMNMYKFISFFLLLVFFYASLYCQTFGVSFVNNKNLSDISVEFDNVIELHNLKLETDKNNAVLITPYYKSKKRQYHYFSFLDKNFKDSVISKIRTGAADKIQDSVSNVDYKINKFNIVDDLPVARAFVSVIFNDLIEVRCSVLKSKHGLWVQWPSKKQNDKWNKLFVIKDKALKDKIENDILNLYNSKNSNRPNK